MIKCLKERSLFCFECPHCGRVWRVVRDTRAAGFVKWGALTHVNYCADRTPAERIKINKRDEQKWARRAPDNQIIIDYSHPGLVA